ncbi:porin [Candidatus Mesenet endosymbiont of Phosphuga atrata]|uniref:porin n=1 Tax=Candidatus Mesenet endosymbiont of Phosphuga atrata TaxID=3066221 RepID=UPI0030CEDA0D
MSVVQNINYRLDLMKKILSITTALTSLVAFYGINVLADPLVEIEQKNVNKEVEQSKQKKISRSDEESDSEVSRVNKAKTKLEEREKRVCDKGCGCKHDSSFKEGPRITIGGGFDTQFHKTSDVKDYDVIPGDDKFADSNALFGDFSHGLVGDYSKTSGSSVDTTLNIRAENTNYDLGLIYGADIKLNVPITKSGSMRSRGAHIFANTEFGDMNVGFMEGAESIMRVDASRIAAGDGGADSDWFKKANLEGNKGNFPFYVTPHLYSESLFSESNWLSFRDSVKYNKSFIDTQPFRISYFSPAFMGLKVGVSYSPNYDSDLFATGGMQKVKYLEPNNKIGEDFNSDMDLRLKAMAGEAAAKIKYKKIDQATIDKIIKVGAVDAAIQAGVVDDTKRDTLIVAIATEIVKVSHVPDVVDNDIKAAIREIVGLEVAADVHDDVVNAAKVTCPIKNDIIAAVKADKSVPDHSTTDANDMANKIIASAAKKMEAAQLNVVDLAAEMKKHADITSKVKFGTAKEFYTLLATSGNYVGPNYENIVSGGISYDYDFDDFKVKVSATGERGQVKEIKGDRYGMYGKYNDLMAFNLGLSAEYFGFKFAASYANLGKSGQPKEICERDKTDLKKYNCDGKKIDKLQKDTYYWTAGAGYEFGSAYVSATYFKSKSAEANELSDIVIGAEYNLALNGSKNPLVPYVTWHHFDTNEKDLPSDKKNNKGDIFLVGVKHNF